MFVWLITLGASPFDAPLLVLESRPCSWILSIDIRDFNSWVHLVLYFDSEVSGSLTLYNIHEEFEHSPDSLQPLSLKPTDSNSSMILQSFTKASEHMQWCHFSQCCRWRKERLCSPQSSNEWRPLFGTYKGWHKWESSLVKLSLVRSCLTSTSGVLNKLILRTR